LCFSIYHGRQKSAESLCDLSQGTVKEWIQYDAVFRIHPALCQPGKRRGAYQSGARYAPQRGPRQHLGDNRQTVWRYQKFLGEKAEKISAAAETTGNVLMAKNAVADKKRGRKALFFQRLLDIFSFASGALQSSQV